MLNKPVTITTPGMDFKKAIRNKVFTDLKRFEGLRLKPYTCPAGKLTIGYGRNLEERGIGEAEAEMMLAADFAECYNQAASLLAESGKLKNEASGGAGALITPENHPADVTVVLVEMIFQLGFTGTKLFKRFLAAIANRDYKLAAQEIKVSLWAKQTPNRVKYLASLLEKLS